MDAGDAILDLDKPYRKLKFWDGSTATVWEDTNDICKEISAAKKDCAKASGVYVRVDKLASFVNDAVRDADTADPACAADEAKPPLPTSESPLAKGIQAWNDQFFNMDSASTRAHAEIYHGRGSQYVHLAKEVSHMVMWPEVQQRITKRLIENYDTLFGTGEGGGESGTTGAFLISGNVGFGRGHSTVSGSLMDLIFPPAEGGTPDAPVEPLHESDAEQFTDGENDEDSPSGTAARAQIIEELCGGYADACAGDGSVGG